MSEEKDIPDNENITDVLQMLKQSYGGNDSVVSVEQAAPEKGFEHSEISEEELKARLRSQFMSESTDLENSSDGIEENSYSIDEDFLAEAELEGETATETFDDDALVDDPEDDSTEEEIEEYFEEEAEELLEEAQTEEVVEDYPGEDLFADEQEELEEAKEELDEPELVTAEAEADEDDDLPWYEDDVDGNEPYIEDPVADIALQELDEDITFDELEEIDEDDGIVYSSIELTDGDTQNGDDVSFDTEDDSEDELLADVESSEDDIAVMHLELERLECEDIDEIEPQNENVAEESEGYEEPEISFKELISGDTYIQRESNVEVTADQTVITLEEIETDAESPAVDEDFLDSLVSDVAVKETKKSEEEDAPLVDSSEISLLMQLGCDDELLERYDGKTIERISAAEALDSIDNGENVADAKKDADEKDRIRTQYDSYRSRHGFLLLKLGIGLLVALILLLYEGLPLIGVELPGILNREEYYVSYVLMGLQAMILCGFICYRRILDGAKKLFTKSPNSYSIITLFAAMTLIYDVSAFFAKEGIPPTFHLVTVIAIVLALLKDCQALTAERRSFEFFFADILFDEEGEKSDGIERFTLCRSQGKNSTAEKMYAGGLDPSQNVYFPVSTDSAAGFFKAQGLKCNKRDASMIVIMPSLIVSLLVGVFAFIAGGEVWIGFGGMMLNLLLSMPVVAGIATWLPFERVSAGVGEDGFAFASQASMEKYAECDMAVFSDLHLFERCAPAKVNLALYDATAKDVLMGCLSAVYSEVGGPMGETFSVPKGKELGKCNLRRVAKSGIEAIVGSNYSVLIGNEAFMQRYGITFPQVSLNDERDRVFTLCVSINGRATARIAARYTVSRVFEMIADRLAEDGIYCAIETMDPMISTELLARSRREDSAPISVVHLNAADYVSRKDRDRDKVLFAASGEELGIIAEGSRLNLAVALCKAKKMKKLRRFTNLLAYIFSGVGALIAFAAAGFGWIASFSEFFVLLYWLICAIVMTVFTVKGLPDRSRFSLEQYEYELEEANKEK